MAGVHLQIDVSDAVLRQALGRLAAAGGNMRLAFLDMGEHLLISHDRRFREQVDPDGTPWEALSERYRKRKKRNKDRILYLDGYLADHLRYQASPDHLAFGTNRVYGATQHFGDADRGIPARPWLGLSAADEAALLAIAARHLNMTVSG